MTSDNVERWLLRRWYGGVRPNAFLRSLACVHALLLRFRRDVAAQRLPVPVIVVGNFTAGGTGKTPLVVALAMHLSAIGYRPAVISRGHGRRSSAGLRVDGTVPVELSGDEPRLIFERTGLPVFVDRDRVAAARSAIDAGCNLLIADDGLQHRRLARDVEIEVIDGARGYGNGLLLPAGPLRGIPRPCAFQVINGGKQLATGAWPMQLQLRDGVSLSDPSLHRPLTAFAGCPVFAVAGIGNPSRFFSALREAGLEFVERPFGDHHEFTRADFPQAAGPVLMTEKDAVKCRGLGLADAWAVPVEASLPPEFFSAVAEKLKACQTSKRKQ